MEKTVKFKLILGLFYLILVGLFLFFLFSKFTFEEITSYEFIKNNRDYFFELKKSNLFLLSIIFILFTITWAFAGGFGSPVAIFAGFIFGKMTWIINCCNWLVSWCNITLSFCKFFFKRIDKR